MGTTNTRLATLLRVREAERDQRRTELAEAVHSLDLVRQHMVELAHEAERLQRLTREASRPGTLNINRLLNSHRYDLLLEVRHQQLSHREFALTSLVEGRREMVVDADREVRMLEKLIEKGEAHQQLTEQRREQNLLDAAARHIILSPGT